MNYWLVKTEPGDYSWDDLLKDKKTHWDGVRNYQARNNIREMKKDDQVLFYHSVNQKEVVGIAKVSSKGAYQDPTTDDDRWLAVEIKPVKALPARVHLSEIKENKKLAEIHLIRNSRLSVMQLKKSEFDEILKIASKK